LNLWTAPVYHRAVCNKETGIMDRTPAPSDPALSTAAGRALAEAEARRMAAAGKPGPATELGGRDGPDPVRYGDWERKGLAIDF
jgi:hypothetical protein